LSFTLSFVGISIVLCSIVFLFLWMLCRRVISFWVTWGPWSIHQNRKKTVGPQKGAIQAQ
jgi:Na+-transporting methylmalonyl-CoA/oxaloacetate decarboxylase gamma subunit